MNNNVRMDKDINILLQKYNINSIAELFKDVRS